MDKKSLWEWEITANEGWFKWNLSEIWKYKDLLFRFVRRDLIANYQQTVLGYFWIFLQPVLTTLVYSVIFGNIAKIPTDGIPPLLFYLPGTIIWSYFYDCLSSTMYTFQHNSAMFGKVYFPRLIMPLSSVLAHTVRMGVQLMLFLVIYIIYSLVYHSGGPSGYIWLLPLLFLFTALFGLGAGLIICVITSRYRDLDYALQFAIRLFMFATPVVYPTSIVPEAYRFVFWLNPLTAVIETFRAAFYNLSDIKTGYLLTSMVSVILMLVIGITLFKKRELKVMDII